MSGRRSRRKGSDFERLIANKLKPYFPDARRGLGQARSAGEVCDVEGTPFFIECKRHRRCSIKAAIQQAERATDGRPVVVITKDDGGPIQVTFKDTLNFTVGAMWCRDRGWIEPPANQTPITRSVWTTTSFESWLKTLTLANSTSSTSDEKTS